LGMRAMPVPARTIGDHQAEYVLLLGMLAATCSKIGREIYTLMKQEFGEVEEPVPPGTVGSSTMPQQRNPKLSQDINAAGAERPAARARRGVRGGAGVGHAGAAVPRDARRRAARQRAAHEGADPRLARSRAVHWSLSPLRRARRRHGPRDGGGDHTHGMTVMKTLVALVAIVVLSACATTREGGPPSEPAALDSVLAAWGPAWSSSDAGKLVPLYTEDVYFEDVPLGAVVKNRDGLGGFAAGV